MLAPLILALFLGGAETLYERARAYEEDGASVEAIELYAAVARMDPGSLGQTARADELRLRARRARVELEAAGEEERRGHLPEAMLAAERAFTVSPTDDATRAAARDAYTRCAARRLATAALGARPAGEAAAAVATVLPIPGGDVALEAAVAEALRALGATVVGPARRAEATIVVRGTAGDPCVLRVEDRAAGGAALASVSVRSLATSPSPRTSTTEPPLEATIESESASDVRSLKSGERFRLRVKTGAEVAIVLLDSRGRASVVEAFPEGDPRWYFLDENPGTETFLVAASRAPVDDIDALARDIEAAGDPAIGAEILRRRGCAVRRLTLEHR